MLTTVIVAAIVCGLIGGGAGYVYRKKIAEGKIGQAEVEAQRIIATAQQNAEARKKNWSSKARKKSINCAVTPNGNTRNAARNYSALNGVCYKKKNI